VPNYAVKLASGRPIPLSSFRGKVVALLFVSTTCPHCQETCRLMSSLMKEYRSRGLETVAVAYDPMAKMLVPEFIQKSGATFPVGYDVWESVAAFLQRPAILQTYVPIMVFIDRQGVIRGQYLGDDSFFKDSEKNIRSTIEKLLKTPAAAKKRAP
jgi:peroxiredoxin